MTFDEWYTTQKHQLSNEQVCRVIWEAAAREEREACANVCRDLAEGCGKLKGWVSAEMKQAYEYAESDILKRSNAK